MSDLPHIDKRPETEAEWFQALMDLARYLRSPEGCPWDREQSSADFIRFLQEEAEELREASDSGDALHIAEEYGDTLFTLLAGIAAAEEAGSLSLTQVLEAIHEKMIRRHEHVFGENKAATPEDAIKSWDRIKQEEKARRANQSD